MKTPIEILASESWPEKVCKKLSPLHWNDLQQELFLLIATDLQEKAAKAITGGYFEFFYIRCASNLSASGGRIGKINQGGEPIEDFDFEEVEDEHRERQEADIQERLDAVAKVQAAQPWYEAKLCEMYLSGMSRRKIHRLTKISLNEVSRVIREFKQQVYNEYL